MLPNSHVFIRNSRRFSDPQIALFQSSFLGFHLSNLSCASAIILHFNSLFCCLVLDTARWRLWQALPPRMSGEEGTAAVGISVRWLLCEAEPGPLTWPLSGVPISSQPDSLQPANHGDAVLDPRASLWVLGFKLLRDLNDAGTGCNLASCHVLLGIWFKGSVPNPCELPRCLLSTLAATYFGSFFKSRFKTSYAHLTWRPICKAALHVTMAVFISLKSTKSKMLI